MMPKKAYTYDEWNEKGYFVRKGEKATFKNGKHLFFEGQVEKKGKKPYSTPAKKEHDYTKYTPQYAVPKLIAEGNYTKRFDASLDIDEQEEYWGISEGDLPF